MVDVMAFVCELEVLFSGQDLEGLRCWVRQSL